MTTKTEALAAAQAALKLKRADGTLKPRKPLGASRSKSLKAYLVEHHGTDFEGRRLARADYKRLKTSLGLAPAIKQVCFNCVGGAESVTLTGETSPGGDVGGKHRVRDCAVTRCPLHPVRPWQGLKDRKSGDGPEPGEYSPDEPV